jgi:hypothetical protein
MNTKKIITAILLVTTSALARVIVPFESWSQVEAQSTCIAIVRCGEKTPAASDVIVLNATKSDSTIDVVFVLRGTNSLGAARLLTDHKLQKGENYLVFARYENSVYQAYEDYRVIPLGKNFRTNSIVEKSLDEQLHVLFKKRVDDLDKQIKEDQLEKQRLEMLFQK